MLKIQPYVQFDGDGAEAIEFYKQALGAEAQIMTFADAPMDIPEDHKSKIMHATVCVEDGEFFLSDGMPGAPFDAGMRAQLSIGTDDLEKAKKYFAALSDGGSVSMPFDKQFWGDHFGMVTDKFGVKWMVNCGKIG